MNRLRNGLAAALALAGAPHALSARPDPPPTTRPASTPAGTPCTGVLDRFVGPGVLPMAPEEQVARSGDPGAAGPGSRPARPA